MIHMLYAANVCGYWDMSRIGSHIFMNFMAFCQLVMLRAVACQHVVGLTTRQIIDMMRRVDE